MQQRHGSNVLAMELRLPCIKPPKLYMNSTRAWKHIRIRWGYKSEAKQRKQDYFRFLVLQPFLKRYSRRWSPAASVVAIQSMTNTHAASSHEAAIIISSFSKWLLWVIVFTNTAIDVVTDITTGISVIMAIIGTFIKILVDKVNYDMVNKVCGNYQSTRSRKPAIIPKLPPTPEAVITINRAAAGDHGLAARPRFPLNEFVTLGYYCCKYSNR